MNEEKAMHKMRSPQAEEAFTKAKKIASGEATYNPLLNPEVRNYVAPSVIQQPQKTPTKPFFRRSGLRGSSTIEKTLPTGDQD